MKHNSKDWVISSLTKFVQCSSSNLIMPSSITFNYFTYTSD